MDKKKTGLLIKDARIKKGYTQQELGDIVGVTNKAISRWEKGEAFPDVSLLDTLSYTLDLDINEIVLGEKKEENDNAVALEMVQIAKMEKSRKARLFNMQCLAFVVFVVLAVGGTRTIAYGLSPWPVQVLYYGCALCVFAVSYTGVTNKRLLFHFDGKIDKIAGIVSGVSVLYCIFLVCGTLTLLLKGIKIFGLQDAQIGPFMNYQLLFIFFINFISALYLMYGVVVKEKDINIGLYIMVAGMFLSMAYSDLLHRLISPEDFALIFLIDTAVILAIVLAGVAVTGILCKNRSDKTNLSD